MSANVTTTGGPLALLREYFKQTLAVGFEKKLLLSDLMDNQVIPANAGKVIVFNRVRNFAMQPTGLSEVMGFAAASGGDVGALQALKQTTFGIDSTSVPLILIGNDLEISELTLMTAEPNPLPILSKKFLYNGAETIEYLRANVMTGNQANGTTPSATVPSVTYGGNSVSTTVVWGDGSATLTEATLDADITSHLIAAESLNKVYLTLQSRGADFHSKTPGRYATVITPGQAGNLRLDSTFMEVAEKGFNRGENKFESASIGDVYGCRVMVSALLPHVAGTIDATNDEIHRGIALSDDYACAVSHAKGVGTPKVTFLPPTPSAGDVYGIMGYLSWKAYTANATTNTYGGVILKSATTNKAASGDVDDSGQV